MELSILGKGNIKSTFEKEKYYMEQKYYFIKYAKGLDGGFGDYCPPNWEYAKSLKDDSGDPVWFSDGEEAYKFAGKCNEHSTDIFYSTGYHSDYDGDFPVEYAVFTFEVPSIKPKSNAEETFLAYKDKVEELASEEFL